MIQNLASIYNVQYDALIAAVRANYARERLDYHDRFPSLTVQQITRLLSGADPDADRRREVVTTLFAAQQRDPHELWVLLLVAAAAPKLWKRSRDVPEHHRANVFTLAVLTFVEALEDVPDHIYYEDVGPHVLRASARTFSARLKTLALSEVA